MHHPSSSISTKAKIGKNTILGPHSIISENVEIGDDCEIGPFVFVGPNVEIGNRCRISTGVIIGGEPQDKSYKGEKSWVVIGNENVIREYTTITRATGKAEKTIIGNRNYIMTYVHVAHNVKIGNDVVITSGAQLGGHVEIQDFVTIGGLVGIHQFCRVGKLAMVGACSYLSKDFPSFFIGRGNPCRIRGVNTSGLKKYNLMVEYAKLKNIYHTIYRSRLNLSQAICDIETRYQGDKNIQDLLTFIKTSKRGIIL